MGWSCLTPRWSIQQPVEDQREDHAGDDIGDVVLFDRHGGDVDEQTPQNPEVAAFLFAHDQRDDGRGGHVDAGEGVAGIVTRGSGAHDHFVASLG